MRYIFGAFGTNNVGDEAIFEGASKIYPDLIEIYVNKSFRPNSVWYADLLTGAIKFDPKASELIIGGGGLIHCLGAVKGYYDMAVLAKAAGLKVSIQRVGFEAVQSAWMSITKDLLNIADYISVRSLESQRIVKNLIGKDVPVEQDFAYELTGAPIYHSIPEHYQEIIFSSGAGSLSNIDSEIKLLKEVLKYIDVLFVPHSAAWVDDGNNDLVLGHRLWSKLGLWHSSIKHTFRIHPSIPSPYDALYLYSRADGVITSRYHGLVFADICKKPIFTTCINRKTNSFFEDHSDVTIVPEGSDLNHKILIDWIKSL